MLVSSAERSEWSESKRGQAGGFNLQHPCLVQGAAHVHDLPRQPLPILKQRPRHLGIPAANSIRPPAAATATQQFTPGEGLTIVFPYIN